ncbi:MAG: hypothetical protein LUF90_05650 [Rikenellaceae bacterium]|nr:hypothetical protein [Rikenellaceae bacterium]
MIEITGAVIGWLGAFTGIFTSVFYFRRAKKAEVHSKEIATEDQMIELVKKANREALEINRKENEKLRRSISRLEQAVRAINSCNYRNECPVIHELRRQEDPDIIQ